MPPLPSVKRGKSAPVSKPHLPSVADPKKRIQSLGLSLLLADTAEELGLTVQDLLELPVRLKELGVTRSDISPSVANRASNLLRERTDATLWSSNGWIHGVVDDAIAKRRATALSVLQSVPTERLPALVPQDGTPIVQGHRPQSTARRQRTQLFGYAGSKIVLWLGSKGFGFKETRAILEKLGLGTLNDTTVRLFLRAGQLGDGSRGKMPDLTRAQQEEILSKHQDKGGQS